MIEFVDQLPPSRCEGPPTFTPEIKAALSDRPGEWALVDRGVPKSRVQVWIMAARRQGGFKVSQRVTDDRAFDVYVKAV